MTQGTAMNTSGSYGLTLNRMLAIVFARPSAAASPAIRPIARSATPFHKKWRRMPADPRQAPCGCRSQSLNVGFQAELRSEGKGHSSASGTAFTRSAFVVDYRDDQRVRHKQGVSHPFDMQSWAVSSASWSLVPFDYTAAVNADGSFVMGRISSCFFALLPTVPLAL